MVYITVLVNIEKKKINGVFRAGINGRYFTGFTINHLKAKLYRYSCNRWGAANTIFTCLADEINICNCK